MFKDKRRNGLFTKTIEIDLFDNDQFRNVSKVDDNDITLPALIRASKQTRNTSIVCLVNISINENLSA